MMDDDDVGDHVGGDDCYDDDIGGGDYNKLASLEATLVRNCTHWLTHRG